MINSLRSILKTSFFEKMLTHITYGKEVDSLIGKMPPNYTLYEPGSWRTFERDGIKICVDISDFIGYMAYFGFKDETIDSFYSLIRPNQVVLDIGANIGITVLNIAKKLKGTGKVIAFEPDPLNFKQLKKNISLNNFKNIELQNIGLGAEKSIQKLHTPTNSNRGGNRINNGASDKYTLVQIETLNSFAEINLGSKVDLVKIDVEGFEYKVLDGGRRFLKTHQPILFIELDDNNLREQGDSAVKLLNLLQDCGYIRFIKANSGEQIDANYLFTNTHFDILCYPQVSK